MYKSALKRETYIDPIPKTPITESLVFLSMFEFQMNDTGKRASSQSTTTFMTRETYVGIVANIVLFQLFISFVLRIDY